MNKVGRPFKVEITENLEQLEKSLKQARSASQSERLQMLVWLKRGEVSSREALATRAGRNCATITRWLKQYKTGGLAGLLVVKKAPGAVPKLHGAVLERLKARLAEPEGFSSYGAIAQWLEQTCQVSIKPDTLYQTVRYKLKAKLKVPRPRSLKQAPLKQAQFKKKLLSS
jgi:transposase